MGSCLSPRPLSTEKTFITLAYSVLEQQSAREASHSQRKGAPSYASVAAGCPKGKEYLSRNGRHCAALKMRFLQPPSPIPAAQPSMPVGGMDPKRLDVGKPPSVVEWVCRIFLDVLRGTEDRRLFAERENAAKEIMGSLLRLAYAQEDKNPVQFLTHAFTTHSMPVARAMLDAATRISPRILASIQDAYGLQASEARFVIAWLGLVHDVGYPSLKKGDIKSTHGPYGASVLEDLRAAFARFLGKKIEDPLFVLLWDDLQNGVFLHSADVKNEKYSCCYVTSRGPFVSNVRDEKGMAALLSREKNPIAGMPRDILETKHAEPDDPFLGRKLCFGDAGSEFDLGLPYTSADLYQNPLLFLLRLFDNCDTRSATRIMRDQAFAACTLAVLDPYEPVHALGQWLEQCDDTNPQSTQTSFLKAAKGVACNVGIPWRVVLEKWPEPLQDAAEADLAQWQHDVHRGLMELFMLQLCERYPSERVQKSRGQSEAKGGSNCAASIEEELESPGSALHDLLYWSRRSRLNEYELSGNKAALFWAKKRIERLFPVNTEGVSTEKIVADCIMLSGARAAKGAGRSRAQRAQDRRTLLLAAVTVIGPISAGFFAAAYVSPMSTVRQNPSDPSLLYVEHPQPQYPERTLERLVGARLYVEPGRDLQKPVPLSGFLPMRAEEAFRSLMQGRGVLPTQLGVAYHAPSRWPDWRVF